ncbi:FxsA family protein [Marinobacter sp. X15-166B]|uniref:FxsA family protein n=1 Tax=Marinobacter sp. X15-166B TaxID=1897620 RepID=UPI00085C8308|nr:FxsA family protein [Marinobacter sp. X15-166B]OEY65124.1 exlusion protein FxsA [Marinobacter sp. X15-166B]
MPIVVLVFIIVPIVEMAVLIKVGTMIGVLSTVALVFLTAIVGAALLRQQGLATLLKANQRLNSGELPGKEVAEGILIAVGGVLLLTPGFVTDALGLLCLLPGSRQWLAARVLKKMVVSGSVSGFQFRGSAHTRDPFGPEGDVFEGEYRDETRRDSRTLGKNDDKTES